MYVMIFPGTYPTRDDVIYTWFIDNVVIARTRAWVIEHTFVQSENSTENSHDWKIEAHNEGKYTVQ